MTQHAKLSASGSHRWLNCPGSVKAEEAYPNTTSFHAQEGTSAHALAEHCLLKSVTPESQIGQTFEGFTVDNYMAEFVQIYVDYVKQFSGEHFYEVRLDFGEYVPDGFGTADCVVLDTRDKTIRVIDLKYGQGVMVDAENNTQGMLYALGALSEYDMVCDFETVEIAIVQPRRDHISEWSISTSDLLAFGEYVKKRAALALSYDAPRVPSDKACQWCAAKVKCTALKNYTEQTLLNEFDAISDSHLKPIDELSDDQLRQALDAKKLIVGWLDAVEKHVTGKLTNGETFDGYKLVEGRSLRKWRDESEVETVLVELLGDKAFSKSLLSVAQAEKAVGKTNVKKLADYISKPPGKPTLAPESDKRKSIGASVDDFDKLS